MPSTPMFATTPLVISVAQPLSASLARVTLQSTQEVATTADVAAPAFADTQPGGLIFANVTAPQVTAYGAAIAANSPAASPASSIDPFPCSTSHPRSRTRRLSSSSSPLLSQHHTRAERRKARHQMKKA